MFLNVVELLSSRPHCVPYGFREAAEKKELRGIKINNVSDKG